jgi:hypothetical protein
LIDSLARNSRAFSKLFQFAKTELLLAIWFTPVTLSVLQSKPQVCRFIQLSNEMKHQADAIIAIHIETWLFHLRAWEKAVYNHAILTAAQRAIAQANGGGVTGGNGGVAHGNGGVACGNGGVARGTGVKKLLATMGNTVEVMERLRLDPVMILEIRWCTSEIKKFIYSSRK